MSLTNLAILAGITSFFITYFFTPIAIKIAKALDLIDDPRKSKHPKTIHTYPVPRGGGLPLLIGIVLSSLLFIPIDKHLIGILGGAVFSVLIGLADDKFNLNPYLRLFLNFITVLFPVGAGIGISFLSNPLTGGVIDLSSPQITFQFLGRTRSIWVLSDLFGIFWLIFLMNMLNMGAKGVDGQLSGTVSIAAIIIAIMSTKFSADITQWSVIILALITAGAFLGFLPWHIYPQKIMPGYGGSTLGGYLLGILSILSTTKVGTLLVVLGIPIIDTFFVITRRILSGKSPVWGDRTHLHHRLLDSGLSKSQVSLFYWLTTALLGLLALNLHSRQKLYTILGIFTLLVGLSLYLQKKEK